MAIPPYLTLSWFAIEHRYAAGKSVAHHADRRECLGLVLHADARIRSISRRRESIHDLRPGMVGVVPADHAAHTVLVAPRAATAAFLLLVPPEVVRDIGAAEGIDCGSDVPEEIAFDSHSHFTRTFRAWTGMTPLRYLRAFHPAGRPAPAREQPALR